MVVRRDRHRPDPDFSPTEDGTSGGAYQDLDDAEPSLAQLLLIVDWRHFVPETVVIICLIVVLQHIVPNISDATAHLPNPLWVPVLLMSCQYGIMGGLFATLCSSGVVLAGDLPVRSASQEFYAYAGTLAAQPCSWFATALVLGGLRTLHLHRLREMTEVAASANRMATGMSRGLRQAVQEVNELERRLAEDSTTKTRMLYALARLDLSSRSALLTSFGKVLFHGLGVTTFVIYLFESGKLRPFLTVSDGVQVTTSSLGYPDGLEATAGDLDSNPDTLADNAPPAPASPYTFIRHPATDEIMGLIVCRRFISGIQQDVVANGLQDAATLLGMLLSISLPGEDVAARAEDMTYHA